MFSWADGLSLRRPSAHYLDAYVDTLALRPLSYATPGMTLEGEAPPGYRRTDATIAMDNSIEAIGAMRAWTTHDQSWVEVHPREATIEPGRDVAVLARAAGLRWLVPARIVAVIDEAQRWGFAYGTVEGHVVTGEELFVIEQGPDGTRLRITAFSRPVDPLVAVASPLVRRFQHRFVAGALDAVGRASSRTSR